MGHIFVPQTSHEGGTVKAPLIDVARQSGQEAVLPHRRMFARRRALPHETCSRCLTGPLAEPQLLSVSINQCLPTCALWSCGRRVSVVQAQRQIHRVLAGCLPRCIESVARAHLLTAALMPAEPHIRSPFSERLAPQSLILEVIGLGRAGPHCMAAYHSHRLRRSARPDPTGLIRPRGTRDNDSAFPDASDCLHDSTRRDLAMGDVSREGDKQFAGERYDRDAADPAALGANALAEPTAESTVGLVSYPHPGKLDHCGAQT